MSDNAARREEHGPVDVAALTPEDPTYVGNLAVDGKSGRVHLPREFVQAHGLAEDQVEAYRVGDALILLPDRHREAAARYLSEVLTKDLVAGSGVEFSERGSFELKGVPGTWSLFTVS